MFRKLPSIASLITALSLGCAAKQSPILLKTQPTSEEERIKTYQTYSAQKLIQETTVQEDGTSIETGRYRSVLLGNQQKITDPVLLKELVPQDSETRLAIQTYEKKKIRERRLRIITLAGLAITSTGIGIGTSLTKPDDTLTPLGTTITVASTLGFVGLVFPLSMRFVATDEKRTARSDAFSSYNASLKQQFNLCEEEDQIFDCGKVPDFAADSIAPTSNPNQSDFERCDESRRIGETLSAECLAILKKGTPQKAPEVDETEPDLAEQEFSLMLNLAEVRMRAGKFEEAIKLLQEAKILRPNESIVTFAMGEVYRNQNNPAEACTQYNAYIKEAGNEASQLDEIKAYLAGIDKTKHKTCDFELPKPR